MLASAKDIIPNLSQEVANPLYAMRNTVQRTLSPASKCWYFPSHPAVLCARTALKGRQHSEGKVVVVVRPRARLGRWTRPCSPPRRRCRTHRRGAAPTRTAAAASACTSGAGGGRHAAESCACSIAARASS
eukprot:2342935-Pleurochrysis_carterae.AAC.2